MQILLDSMAEAGDSKVSSSLKPAFFIFFFNQKFLFHADSEHIAYFTFLLNCKS